MTTTRKTKITKAFLKRNGFVLYKKNGKTELLISGNMVFEFGASNIPVLKRRIVHASVWEQTTTKSGEPVSRRKPGTEELEFIAGVEHWEDVGKFYYV